MRLAFIACVALIAGMFLCSMDLCAQNRESNTWMIARLKYSGGGDWYNDPSAIPNLARFMNANTNVHLQEQEIKIDIMDERLFSFPVLFLTGHGRVAITNREAERLRLYLESGGFLYADDDYGLDASFRQAMKQVFPDRMLVELSFSHGIYSIHYRFPDGLPKIHEHDDKAPQGFGILDDDKIERYFELGCEVKGLGRGHINRIKERVRKRKMAAA